MARQNVRGETLKVGDRIAPWGGRPTTIVEIENHYDPYHAKYGVRIAKLRPTQAGDWQGKSLTLHPRESYELVTDGVAV